MAEHVSASPTATFARITGGGTADAFGAGMFAQPHERRFVGLLGLLLTVGCGGGGGRVGYDAGATPVDDAGSLPPPGTPLPDGSGGCVGDPVTLLGVSLDSWSYGDLGTAYMRPGGDCMDCHNRGGGPRFTAAGSVMDAWHEPDDCFGMQGVTVEILGGDGVTTRLTTNETGNFYTSDAIATPYTAKVIGADGATREMFTPQTDLDCMHCHTQAGANGAPGRIGHP